MADPLRPPTFWYNEPPLWIELTPQWVETDATSLLLPDVFAPLSWEIDSSLELIADHWSAQMAESIYFRLVSPDDTVTLQAGLLDANGNPVIITALTDGIIDEREITVGPKEFTVTMQGRDASWAILDSYFTKLYARSQAALTPALQAFSEIEPGQTELLTIPRSQIGNFRASDVAKDAVAFVGMSLSWEVRDYELLTPLYHASGRVIDILRSLIAPWILCDPFRADITIQGTTVRIKHRAIPFQPMPPQYVMTVAGAKRSGVTIRRRILRKIGTVTLRGRRAPAGLRRSSAAEIGTGLSVFQSGTQVRTTENDAFDKAGQQVSAVVSKDTYRIPDGILLRSVKETSTVNGLDPGKLTGASGSAGAQLQLVSRETVENEWEPSYYDQGGAVNAPKQKTQAVFQEGIDRDNDTNALFRLLNQFFIEYQYDANGFKTGETTTKQKFSFDDFKMVNTEQIIKTYHDVGPLLVEEVVDTFKWDSDKKAWIISQHFRTVSGGHRAGGPGRGSGSGDPVAHYTLVKKFSSDKIAQNIDYSNEDLTLDDLNFIMLQFEAMADLVEYEFQFSGVGMPWLRRGVTIQFTDLPLEPGITLTPVVATITEIKTRYAENGSNSSYTIDCRAFGWTKEAT